MAIHSTLRWSISCDGWPGEALLGAHEVYESVDYGDVAAADVVRALRGEGWSISRVAGGWVMRCPRHRRTNAERKSIDETRAALAAQEKAGRLAHETSRLARCVCGHVANIHRWLSADSYLECLQYDHDWNGRPAAHCGCIVFRTPPPTEPAAVEPA